MPPRRDLQQGDETARQLFGGINQFPQLPSFGSMTGVAQKLQNAVPSLPALAATGISALKNAVSSTPLIRTDYGLPSISRNDFRNPADQWDARPVQQTSPTAPQFAAANPRAATQDDINYFFNRGPYAPAAARPTIAATPPPQLTAPEQAFRPREGFAMVSDWSKNPMVQAARATGDISKIEEAVKAARNQGRGAFQPQDFGESLAGLRATRPEAGFGSSRTPEQQQALLAQMRTQGVNVMRKNLAEQESIIAQRRAYPELYTTPSFKEIAAPTNMFGQPIASWQKTYEAADKINDAALAKMRGETQPIAQRTERIAPKSTFETTSRFEYLNSFNPSENFTGSIASNYAPPTTSGFGNRTRISGKKINASPMAEGIMPAFDLGMSVIPSYMSYNPFKIGAPTNSSIAMGINRSPLNSGFSAIF